jgi:methionine sulfoxide reductase heme-binding subunit
MPAYGSGKASVFEGWRLVGLIAAAILLASLALVVLNGADAAAVRLAIRNTARSSLALFLLAFGAASLHRLWQSRWSAWQLRNRRNLGVGFAISHATHAALIITFAVMAPAEFHEATSPATFIFGGTTYLFIIAMTATSFDRSAAWLGRRRWRLLHGIGGHVIWLNFLASEAKRAPQDPRYWGFVALVLAVMALRLIGRAKTRPAVLPPRQTASR